MMRTRLLLVLTAIFALSAQNSSAQLRFTGVRLGYLNPKGSPAGFILGMDLTAQVDESVELGGESGNREFRRRDFVPVPSDEHSVRRSGRGHPRQTQCASPEENPAGCVEGLIPGEDPNRFGPAADRREKGNQFPRKPDEESPDLPEEDAESDQEEGGMPEKNGVEPDDDQPLGECPDVDPEKASRQGSQAEEDERDQEELP